MAYALIKKMQLKEDISIDSAESIVKSINEAQIRVCKCEDQPCDCNRMKEVNGHTIGFSIPTMNAHMSPLSPNANLAYLMNIELARAHYPQLQNDVTASPQVSSSNQELATKRRRKKKTPHLRIPLTKLNKLYANRNISLSGEKKHKCMYCSQLFGYKHVLQNHLRTHTGEKPFQCLQPGCGRSFTRDHHLKTHIRLHTGEKPFVCQICDKRFVQVANLRRHMRVHTGERPYVCESCPATFSDSNQLNAHRLTHEESETDVIVVDEVVDIKPIRTPVYIPYYRILSQQQGVQEEPEDLSMKGRLISS